MKKIKKDFIMSSLYPTVGIVAMDFSSLEECKEAAKKFEITHWVMSGVVQDGEDIELKTIYEEKDGAEIINLFELEKQGKL